MTFDQVRITGIEYTKTDRTVLQLHSGDFDFAAILDEGRLRGLLQPRVEFTRRTRTGFDVATRCEGNDSARSLPLAAHGLLRVEDPLMGEIEDSLRTTALSPS